MVDLEQDEAYRDPPKFTLKGCAMTMLMIIGFVAVVVWVVSIIIR